MVRISDSWSTLVDLHSAWQDQLVAWYYKSLLFTAQVQWRAIVSLGQSMDLLVLTSFYSYSRLSLAISSFFITRHHVEELQVYITNLDAVEPKTSVYDHFNGKPTLDSLLVTWNDSEACFSEARDALPNKSTTTWIPGMLRAHNDENPIIEAPHLTNL